MVLVFLNPKKSSKSFLDTIIKDGFNSDMAICFKASNDNSGLKKAYYKSIKILHKNIHVSYYKFLWVFKSKCPTGHTANLISVSISSIR